LQYHFSFSQDHSLHHLDYTMYKHLEPIGLSDLYIA